MIVRLVQADFESLRRRVLSAVRSLILLMLTFSAVQAEEKPLAIETSKMQPSLVLGRPMLTWWDVKIQTSGLMVGKFKFVIKHDRELLATMETEELTLNGPEQRIRVTLPTIDSLSPIDQLQVDISFRGKHYSGNLGEQILHVPFAKKKVFIGLAAESSTVRKGAPKREKLMDRLRFENVVPLSKAYRSAEMDRDYIKTVYASVDPADLPSEPLAYCGYDIVIAAGDEFRSLRKPQLEALLSWIKSGGSLYLEPNGVLEPYHLDFLRNLVADDRRGIVMQADQAGKLTKDFAATRGPGFSVTCGLGHAAIGVSDPVGVSDPDRESNDADDDWIRLLRPLWNSRFEPIETPTEPQPYYMNTGMNPAQAQSSTVNTNPQNLARALPNPCRLVQTELLERLMPEGVRMVPLSLLALILFVFVVLIGPGDYYILGWLRLRKLTWITFPLTTLCITMLTVSLSNSYMSSAETRRAVSIRDLGPGGEIVRTNRFELLYIAASRWVTTDVEKGFFASLRTGGTSMNPNTGMVERDTEDVSSIRIAGRIPTEFAVAQNVSKWTPQVNRIFSIPGTSDKPGVDWNNFNLPEMYADMLRKHVVPPKLVDQVHRDFGRDALVACFTGQGGWANDPSDGWLSKRTPQSDQLNPMNRWGRGRGWGWDSSSSIPEIQNAKGQNKPDFFLWLYRMSVGFPGTGIIAPTSGIFALVHETAPTGSSNCQDLPLLDSSDPGAWLLVIIVPGNQETIVYRKPMRFE